MQIFLTYIVIGSAVELHRQVVLASIVIAAKCLMVKGKDLSRLSILKEFIKLCNVVSWFGGDMEGRSVV